MGNGLSDTFFPDNPSRKKRAYELQTDLENLKALFEKTKSDNQEGFTNAKAKLDAVLKGLGINTLDDLDRKIQESASGETLENWKKVSSVLDKLDHVEGTMYGLIGIVALAGLTIVTVGALLGPIGFMAGVGVVGEITAVLGAIAIVFSIIDGAVQRDKLRSAINDLFKERIKARRVVEQLKAITYWTSLVEALLINFNPTGNSKADMDALALAITVSAEKLKPDYEQWTWEYTANQLAQLDAGRNSWTNEDPNINDAINQLKEEERTGVASRASSGDVSISDVGNALANTASDIGNSAAGVATNAGNTIVGTATNVGNTIAGTATNVGNTIAGTATNVGNTIAGTATDAGNALTGVGNTIGSTLGGIFSFARAPSVNMPKIEKLDATNIGGNTVDVKPAELEVSLQTQEGEFLSAAKNNHSLTTIEEKDPSEKFVVVMKNQIDANHAIVFLKTSFDAFCFILDDEVQVREDSQPRQEYEFALEMITGSIEANGKFAEVSLQSVVGGKFISAVTGSVTAAANKALLRASYFN